MSPDNRNMIAAMTLSLAILVFWQLFFVEPELEADRTAAIEAQQSQQLDAEGRPLPAQSAGLPSVAEPVDEAVVNAPRLVIDAPLIKGSLSLMGGRIDDIILPAYQQTQEADAQAVRLLRKLDDSLPYFAEFGWVGSADSAQNMPDEASIWSASHSVLSPDQPVTLSWSNGTGLAFERIITVNDDYLITITDKVRSDLDTQISLNPYGLVRRHGTPQTLGMYILHEGPLGVFDETLSEQDYSDLQEAGRDGISYATQTNGGWVGFTDKYWLAALIPSQMENVDFSMRALSGAQPRYQTDYLGQTMMLPAGGEISWSASLFAGAKKVDLLDKYADELGIKNFDLAIDFGWFYFLTKPFFYALTWIHSMVGNFGVAIIVFTILMRLAMYPLASKSYRSMGKMRELAPQIQAMREAAGDDRTKLNQDMMALYRKEKVNPAAGCLPILLQIPIFFALYKVLYVSIEMRHAPFFGWIQDLSAVDPTSIFNLFGLLPYSVDMLPQFLSIGIWPIAMGITMHLQMRMNPPPPDPIQAKIFQYMPIFFTFLLAGFPAGLVIYWTWNNLLSIAQQWWITYSMKKEKK
ncbi:MAG: membrane protein insertase YidC [Candidatus Puniceispirillaceae bacterium]